MVYVCTQIIAVKNASDKMYYFGLFSVKKRMFTKQSKMHVFSIVKIIKNRKHGGYRSAEIPEENQYTSTYIQLHIHILYTLVTETTKEGPTE